MPTDIYEDTFPGLSGSGALAAPKQSPPRFRIALDAGKRKSETNVKDLSDLELDEHALIKKKRPWGWFMAGLVALGAITFGLGFALPLDRAHATLQGEHEALAKKAAELDQAFIATKTKLDSTEKERSELERLVTTVRDGRKELASRLQIVGATAERQLAPYVKAKLATVAVNPETLQISLKNRLVFMPRSAKVNPRLKKTLCTSVEGAAQEKGWRVTATISPEAGNDDPWEALGERSGTLAALLGDECKLSPEAFRTQIGLTSQGLEEDSTQLSIGPLELPALPPK